MKYFIASDIHGSAWYCKRMLDAFEKENCSILLLLGDILYHGPRNDLPRDYAPKKVIAMLNPLKDRIFCVRGNCDTEVDQMVLDFPIMAEYSLLCEKGKLIFATHGHKYNLNTKPQLPAGSVLLHGHTHVPACTKTDTFTYINPGSVSIPKEESPHSYMTLEDSVFLWKSLEDGSFCEIWKTFEL